MSTIPLEELDDRIGNLEKSDLQDLLTIVELMSNITFFGGIKRTNCQNEKDGQCSFFCLQSDAKNKIPIATHCRIAGCTTKQDHYHLEISNITCTFCPQWNNKQSPIKSKKNASPRRKNKRKETQP